MLRKYCSWGDKIVYQRNGSALLGRSTLRYRTANRKVVAEPGTGITHHEGSWFLTIDSKGDAQE